MGTDNGKDKNTDKEVMVEILSDLHHRRGLTAETLLDEATDAEHPLHARFTWDDTEAARRWRLNEASEIIRSVKIRFEASDGPADLRAYVNVKGKQTPKSHYVPVEEALDDPLTRKMLLAEMKRDWLTFKRRWEHMSEFADLIASNAA